MTIKEIAKKANVSIATVSRIINNKTEGYSEETRKHVQKIIDELNYSPNTIARGMVTKKTYTLGLVIQDIANPFFPKMVRGIEDIANQYGYFILLCNTDGSVEKEENYISFLKGKRVDGIIITTSNGNDPEYIQQITEGDIPFVFLDEIAENTNCVCIDNEMGGYLATKHLIDLGHINIACIAGPKNSITNLNRIEGFKQALIEFGLELNLNNIYEGSYKTESGYSNMKKILKDNNDVSAVFCINDFNAIGAYKAAIENELQIPKDISIVGFDDIYKSLEGQFGLTSISQPAYELGKTSAKMLIDIINNKWTQNVVVLEPELVIKNSSDKYKEKMT